MSKSITPSAKPNYLFWIYQAILIIAVAFLLFNVIFRNEKIAYVDSGKILNEYKGAEEAKKAFQSKAKVWQDNIDTLTSEVKKSIGDYEKSLAVMSPKEQSLAKELIQTKQRQLADYQKGTQENAREEDGKLTQSVVAQINGFLLKYGKAHHYKMILIANQSGTIAYAREGLDITSEVLEDLNNEFTAGKK